MSARRVVVLGGGISGLAAANRVRELARERREPVEVTLFERSGRIGGCIETIERGGVVAELGPDALVTEKPAALSLLHRLQLDEEIVPLRSTGGGARVVRHGELVPLPTDFRLFAPASLAALARSSLFSPIGLMRAALEPLVPPRRDDSDESVASFVTRRFGREVLARLAQPLVGGIYSGDPEHLSMSATLPHMRRLEREYGSMIRAMSGSRTSRPQPPRMASLRGGLQQLIRALERELASSLRTGVEVQGLETQTDDAGERRWNVALDGGRRVEADAVICALPAPAAGDVLSWLIPGAALRLHAIPYHGVATVTLTFRREDLPKLPACTGFVVPAAEHRSVMSVTFSSQKFESRAPEDIVLLRAFLGGALQPHLLALDDRTLVGLVRKDLRELLDIGAMPQWSLVRRWPHALPEYSVGHCEEIEWIEHHARSLPAFALAGAAYHGAGIADCIRSGELAAESVFASA